MIIIILFLTIPSHSVWLDSKLSFSFKVITQILQRKFETEQWISNQSLLVLIHCKYFMYNSTYIKKILTVAIISHIYLSFLITLQSIFVSYSNNFIAISFTLTWMRDTRLFLLPCCGKNKLFCFLNDKVNVKYSVLPRKQYHDILNKIMILLEKILSL